MNLTPRDRKIVMGLAPLLVVLVYWFVLLAPKREEAATSAATLEALQADLAQAESQATTVDAAKANFARDYAAVVALGKAIPESVDMPSLLVQLEQAARGTGIELNGVTAGEREEATQPGAAAAVPGAPDPAASGQPAPADGAAAPSGEPAQADPAAPAGGAGAPAPPGGAAAGATAAEPAGPTLEKVPLEFDFEGSFFELTDFFHRLKRFVYVSGDKVRVRGRLMTIDAVTYKAAAAGFPALSATVKATVYLSPKSEGATAGATPAGPGGTPAAAAPTSTASSGAAPAPAPAPAATATPAP